MARGVLQFAVFLTMVAFASVAKLQYPPRYQLGPYADDEEYPRHINSELNTHRGDKGRYTVDTDDARLDNNYHAWKRNADFINSILALPKGMNDAGR